MHPMVLLVRSHLRTLITRNHLILLIIRKHTRKSCQHNHHHTADTLIPLFRKNRACQHQNPLEQPQKHPQQPQHR